MKKLNKKILATSLLSTTLLIGGIAGFSATSNSSFEVTPTSSQDSYQNYMLSTMSEASDTPEVDSEEYKMPATSLYNFIITEDDISGKYNISFSYEIRNSSSNFDLQRPPIAVLYESQDGVTYTQVDAEVLPNNWSGSVSFDYGMSSQYTYKIEIRSDMSSPTDSTMDEKDTYYAGLLYQIDGIKVSQEMVLSETNDSVSSPVVGLNRINVMNWEHPQAAARTDWQGEGVDVQLSFSFDQKSHLIEPYGNDLMQVRLIKTHDANETDADATDIEDTPMTDMEWATTDSNGWVGIEETTGSYFTWNVGDTQQEAGGVYRLEWKYKYNSNGEVIEVVNTTTFSIDPDENYTSEYMDTSYMAQPTIYGTDSNTGTVVMTPNHGATDWTYSLQTPHYIQIKDEQGNNILNTNGTLRSEYSNVEVKEYGYFGPDGVPTQDGGTTQTSWELIPGMEYSNDNGSSTSVNEDTSDKSQQSYYLYNYNQPIVISGLPQGTYTVEYWMANDYNSSTSKTDNDSSDDNLLTSTTFTVGEKDTTPAIATFYDVGTVDTLQSGQDSEDYQGSGQLGFQVKMQGDITAIESMQVELMKNYSNDIESEVGNYQAQFGYKNAGWPGYTIYTQEGVNDNNPVGLLEEVVWNPSMTEATQSHVNGMATGAYTLKMTVDYDTNGDNVVDQTITQYIPTIEIWSTTTSAEAYDVSPYNGTSVSPEVRALDQNIVDGDNTLDSSYTQSQADALYDFAGYVDPSTMSMAMLIGIIVGSVVGTALIGTVIYYYYHKHHKHNNKKDITKSIGTKPINVKK